MAENASPRRALKLGGEAGIALNRALLLLRGIGKQRLGGGERPLALGLH